MSFKTSSNTRKQTSTEKHDMNKKMEGAYSVLQDSLQKPAPQKDMCDIYGELVAAKLRKMDEYSRQICMHGMDEVLFEMLMNPTFVSNRSAVSPMISDQQIPQPESTEEKKSTKCKLVMKDTPITKIEPGTLILYLATTRGDEDPIMKGMSTKFNFVRKFRAHRPKVLGDIIYSEDKNYGFCGCFVRNTISEPISYKSLSKCLQNINKKNKQFGSDAFNYVALQWVDAEQYCDDLVNEKVIMMLRNYLYKVEVYVCTGSFENQ